jgi:hypothetical protein
LGDGTEVAQVVEGACDAADAWPVPSNLVALLNGQMPEPEFLDFHRLIPVAAKVLGVGPAESGKSLWAMWLGCQLSRSERTVAYFSQENPLAEDLRRLKGLRPDIGRFRFFYGQGVDLARADHVPAVLRAIDGCAICVFDTLSACWSGDESDNAAFAALDAQVLTPITAAGCSPVILDHTGHAQAFVQRRGVSAPRGASSKGQKVDVLIEFRPVAESEFRLEVGKMRVGGIRPRPIGCRVVDLDDDGLDIETEAGAVDPAVAELAEQMVVAIENAGELTTNALRSAAPASRQNQAEAIRLLESEDPPRVRTTAGPRRSKLWVPVTWGLE